MNVFFMNALDEKAEEKRSKLDIIAKYPYLYRFPESDVPPGTIGIMPGSHFSEVNADATMTKLSKRAS